MKKFLILWSFIISHCINNVYLEIPPPSCGVPKIRKSELIVNGYETTPGAWPWHVAIYRKDGRTNSYICGGTLISEIFVLTAAHCVRDENGYQPVKKRIFVRLGLHNLDVLNTKAFQQHSIHNIHKPSNSVNRKLKNDIALLELATDAEFTDYVQPACISVTRDLTGQFGTVIGWGVTEDDEVSSVLKSSQMPAIDYMTCLESDRKLFGATLDEGIFCAGYTNGTSVCNGDSGGGIFFNKDNVWYVGGIISFSLFRSDGTKLCYPKGYAGFTKVYTYLSWISKVTKLQFLIEQLLTANGGGIVPLSTQIYLKGDTCSTSLGKPGQCVPLGQCRFFFKDDKPSVVDMVRFIKRVACHLPNVTRSMCCELEQILHPNEHLLPYQCGLSVNERTSKKNVTNVFDYPWMAVLQYESNGKIIDGCGGTLINKRYILTAARCVKTRRGLRLVNIRLGEHTKKQEVDCNISLDNNGTENARNCADNPEDYTIQSFVVHTKQNHSADIGLIRLARDVVMKDSIMPICLPITAELRSQVFEGFIATGWGVTEHSTGSNVLMEAFLYRVNNTECQQRMAENWLNIHLSDNQMCAGGQDDLAICRGDSGGPLVVHAMHHDGKRFVQFGVISAAVDSCGLNSVPGIYTRVESYMGWILDNLEP